MYELIRKNKRKSWFVFIGMGLLLLLLGAGIGMALDPEPLSGRGALGGIFIALIIWTIQALFAFLGGGNIVMKMTNAHEITPEKDKELYNIIEELSLATGLPMPKIYIIDTPAMNAFAAGTNPKKSIVAITQGLRSKLNRQEIQAVMAHEMSHIYNRDVLYMTFASIMMCAIVIISEFLFRSFFWRGGGRRSSSSSGGKNDNGIIQLIVLVAVVLLAILAPVLAQLFYFSLSRKREYLADAVAVNFTRDPNSLADALEKISSDNTAFNPGKMAAAMCISKPKLDDHKENLASTHPPIQKRITILRALAVGADYNAYTKAYASVLGKNDLPKDKNAAKKR